jgi:hypothetical protein
MKKLFAVAAAVMFVALSAQAQTAVPGHDRDKYDTDNNGVPDAGVTTVGKYTAVYAWDATGKYFYDLGDGRIQSNVSSVSMLEQSTLSRCDYQNHYRGKFENDAYLNSGWIINNISCSGYEYPNKGAFTYLIVHKSDPRYTGDPNWAIWGEWEYQVLTVAGSGNLAKPQQPDRAMGSNQQ